MTNDRAKIENGTWRRSVVVSGCGATVQIYENRNSSRFFPFCLDRGLQKATKGTKEGDSRGGVATQRCQMTFGDIPTSRDCGGLPEVGED